MSVLVLLFACAGCKDDGGKKKRKRSKRSGVSDTADPTPESPVWVVKQVLRAAAVEPFDQAFNQYSKYLHSSELESAAAMKVWETMRFPALRRKHQTYFGSDAEDPFAYELDELKEIRDDYVQVRVRSKTSDMPTPCHLFKDPMVGGQWRVKMNCLN